MGLFEENRDALRKALVTPMVLPQFTDVPDRKTVDGSLDLTGLKDNETGPVIAGFVKDYVDSASTVTETPETQLKDAEGVGLTVEHLPNQKANLDITYEDEYLDGASLVSDPSNVGSSQVGTAFGSYELDGTIYLNGGGVMRARGKNGCLYQEVSGVSFTLADGAYICYGLTVSVTGLSLGTPSLVTFTSTPLDWVNANMTGTVFAVPLVKWSRAGEVYTCTPYHGGGGIILPLWG